MLKRLVICASLLSAPFIHNAHAGTQQEVRFAKGSSGTLIEGVVARDDRDVYTLGARRGQFLSVKIESKEGVAVFDVYLPGAKRIDNAGISGELAGARESKSQVINLPSNGNYVIAVGTKNGNAQYRLSISITNNPPADSTIASEPPSITSPAPKAVVPVEIPPAVPPRPVIPAAAQSAPTPPISSTTTKTLCFKSDNICIGQDAASLNFETEPNVVYKTLRDMNDARGVQDGYFRGLTSDEVWSLHLAARSNHLDNRARKVVSSKKGKACMYYVIGGTVAGKNGPVEVTMAQELNGTWRVIETAKKMGVINTDPVSRKPYQDAIAQEYPNEYSRDGKGIVIDNRMPDGSIWVILKHPYMGRDDHRKFIGNGAFESYYGNYFVEQRSASVKDFNNLYSSQPACGPSIKF